MNIGPKALKGIRVLDFGRYVAGPWAATLLADFGADVIRVDRIGGSPSRASARHKRWQVPDHGR